MCVCVSYGTQRVDKVLHVMILSRRFNCVPVYVCVLSLFVLLPASHTHYVGQPQSLFLSDACSTYTLISLFHVYQNGTRVPIHNFREYVELAAKSLSNSSSSASNDATKTGESAPSSSFLCERLGKRWEVAIAPSASGSSLQMSFVNSIATVRGGTHMK